MNPLTDELTDEAKQELAAIFADMRRQYQPLRDLMAMRRSRCAQITAGRA